MKKRIDIIYSTHLTEKEDFEFEKNIRETCGVPCSIHRYVNNNQYSLSNIYNKAISEIESEDSIFIFCHNDISFDRKNWGKKLLSHFNNPNEDYQIIGVAGATELNTHGCWWLNSNNQMNFSKMVGIVNHDNGIRKWESRYSEPHFGIKPVVCIDGLFMAVDIDNIENKFDENYGMWHYYDVGFCVPNYLDGCNIGVITDIRITHKSIGMTDPDWERNRIKFSEEYKEFLPLKVD